MTKLTAIRGPGAVRLPVMALVCAIVAILVPAPVQAQVLPYTYDLDSDFDQGTLVNVNHDLADQLQLNDAGEPFEFIWVAASGRGTIVKIDTVTGAVLGEYWSSPAGRFQNPSRTTVDLNGNVWAGNRDEGGADGRGSVVHIGLEENGQCVDRDGSGVIDTSSGLGDIKPWTNAGGADDNGGVSTAGDECIIHYVRTSATNARSLAVDGANNLWVGGWSNRVHELYDSNGVAVSGTQFNLGCGGYGALMDSNGILWSASMTGYTLLRYDPAAMTGTCIYLGRYTYGLGIDGLGNIWNSNYSWNSIAKINPSGTSWTFYSTFGATYDRGVVVTTSDNDIWVANSGGTNVSRLRNDGSFVTTIPVGSTPTGLAVDAAGKVWVTNYNSHNVMRIDPTTNTVDLTVSLGSGAYPYNYSDMTGSTLIAPPNVGTWTVIHNSTVTGQEWGPLSWDEDIFGDGSIVVSAASSADGSTFGPWETASQGVDLTVADGQYLKVRVQFNRSSDGDSPVLYELTIEAANVPPVAVCTDVVEEAVEGCEADGSVDDGSYDPDGDETTVSIDEVPPPPYPLGDTLVTLTITDDFGETDSCTGTVSVVDTTPPEAFCNSPATIIPPDAPIAFTSTMSDYCDGTVEIVGYDCWAINGAGKIISKLESCVVSFDGETVMINDSGGIGDHIDWFVVATDSSGNTTELTCSVEVVKKPKN